MSGRLTVLPSPSLCAAPAGSQGGGLGQRARTWQFQGCLMPGPGLSEADYCTHTHKHTRTHTHTHLHNRTWGRGALGTAGPGAQGFLPRAAVTSPPGAQPLAFSTAHQRPREPKPGTSERLSLLSQGSGEPWTSWTGWGSLFRGGTAIHSKGKSPTTRAAPQKTSAGFPSSSCGCKMP